MPEVKQLAALYRNWAHSKTSDERARIWHEMLEIQAAQQFVIGVVSGVPQPVVARDNLMNVPAQGFFNWDPGAFFGIYHPDTFWYR
jgi:peptide/nickel transport system substrate-binding protein